MKKNILWLLFILLPLFLGGCNNDEEIVFDHERPQFELREGQILLEVIMPQSTAADDEILSDITNLIMSSDSSIQIKGINFNNDDNKFEGFVTVAIQSAAQLNTLFDEIRKIPSVRKIERVSN